MFCRNKFCCYMFCHYTFCRYTFCHGIQSQLWLGLCEISHSQGKDYFEYLTNIGRDYLEFFQDKKDRSIIYRSLFIFFCKPNVLVSLKKLFISPSMVCEYEKYRQDYMSILYTTSSPAPPSTQYPYCTVLKTRVILGHNRFRKCFMSIIHKNPGRFTQAQRHIY